MKTENKWFVRHALGSAVAIALTATTASSLYAQENTDATEAEEAESTEKISVVGSRIRKGGFDSASPLDIVFTDSALKQGIGDLGGLLRNSSSIAGSSQVTPASSTAFVQNGGEGAATIGLRGLGPNRTLVLINGRRTGPAGTRGGVSSFDFNILPLAAVERLDILKDGASSVYGSDAVAGVINVITKQEDGGEVTVFSSLPNESGGEEFRINATYGKTFDKGSFSATVDYRKQSELVKGDRDFYNCGEQYIFDQDTGERADTIDPRTGKAWCNDLLWGHVWLYDYQDGGDSDNVPTGAKAQFDYDGDLGNYLPPLANDPTNDAQIRMPPGFFLVNYDSASDGVTNADHPFQDQESFDPEIETTTVFLQADYDITDNIEVYAEALLNRRESSSNGYRQFWSYKYNENFFATDSLSAGWTGSQWLSPTAITDHNDAGQTVDYARFVAGVTGDINDDWYFDVYAQTSKSDGDYYNDIIYNDSIVDQNFKSGSCVGQTTSVREVPCVDVPWLDPNLLNGEVSDEVRQFLFGRDLGNTEYTQTTVEAFVSGSLFEMPAGTVGMAIGASYQEDEIVDTPGEQTLLSNVWGASAAGITQGKDETVAVFTEFSVPLLSDLPFVEFLDMEISGRYTDVKSFGGDSTYKIGLNWGLTEEWRVRASKGTSFRSPALFELYLADQSSFLGQRAIDPCINWGANLETGAITETIANNCAADGIASDYVGGAISATVFTGGGAGVLEAETSISRNAAIIWTPDFADISFSVDWFDIEISGEVTQLGGANLVRRCYSSEFFGSGEPLCDQFDRDPADQRIVDVRDSFINIASQRNRGYDVKFSYTFEAAGGEFEFYTEHTFQKEAQRALFSDTLEDENGEFGEPKHVASYSLSYLKNNWSLDWAVNYVGAVSNVQSYFDRVGRNTATYRGQEVNIVLGAESLMYHNFSGEYSFDDEGILVRVGLSNVFDKEPPRVTTLNLGELNTQGNSAFYSQYLARGRSLFVNASYEF